MKDTSVFLFILACFAALPEIVSAQDAVKSYVTLKNGEKIEGLIIEAVPDNYIKIELKDGTVRTIKSSEIENIKSDKPATAEKGGLSLIIGFHGSYDLSALHYYFFEPRVIVGKGRLGMGLSFLHGKISNLEDVDPGSLTGASREDLNFLPVFINFHDDIGTKGVKPSVDVSVGYPISLNGKEYLYTLPGSTSNSGYEYNAVTRSIIYFQAAPGVSFKAGKKLLLNLALQYQLLAFNEAIRETYVLYSTKYTTVTGSSEFRLTNSIGLSVNLIY